MVFLSFVYVLKGNPLCIYVKYVGNLVNKKEEVILTTRNTHICNKVTKTKLNREKISMKSIHSRKEILLFLYNEEMFQVDTALCVKVLCGRCYFLF